jgi:hypothetical protein
MTLVPFGPYPSRRPGSRVKKKQRRPGSARIPPLATDTSSAPPPLAPRNTTPPLRAATPHAPSPSRTSWLVLPPRTTADRCLLSAHPPTATPSALPRPLPALPPTAASSPGWTTRLWCSIPCARSCEQREERIHLRSQMGKTQTLAL